MMLKKMFLSIDNTNNLNNIYQDEINSLLAKADQYCLKKITFTHPWDMEICTQEVLFEGQWDLNPFGDPEWTWMLNRHRFIEELACAYFLTRNEKYFYAFQEFIVHWIHHNSIPEKCLKSSWRRIDTGIRIVHWIRAIEYLQVCPLFTQELQDKIISSLYQQGTFLSENITNVSITSNWGILEFHGLFQLSLFYSFKESKQWLDLSLNILSQALKIQILDDGVQWERSPMYHNEVLHCYLMVLLTAKKQDISLDSVFYDKIHSMAMANVKWQKPNNKQVCWGDSDNTDLRSINTLSAYLFQDFYLKSQALETLDLELYLLLGEEGNHYYHKLAMQTPPFTSWFFKETGFLVIRNSWEKDSNFWTLNSKNFGGGHAHSDLLNITFYAREQDYLIDGGRLTYTESSEREMLKSSYGHNTIIINNLESTQYKNSWSNRTEASYINGDWIESNGIGWGMAYNSSYLRQGVLITRNLITFPCDSFLVLDIVQGQGEKTIELKFNSPHDITVHDNVWNLKDLHWIPDPSVEMTIQEAFYSLHYNQKNTSKQVIQKIKSEETTSIYNFFTFNTGKVELLNLVDRKNKPIALQDAFGLKITIDNDEYILLYKIAPNAQHSGFFLIWDNLFFMYSKVLLKKEKDHSYTTLFKYI